MGYDVDFLPVGEGERGGDAIALRIGDLFGNRDEQFVVVIDGGFKDTGEELVEHIKNYYKTDRVDLVISTHPDADHAGGLEVLLDKLKVGCLWMHQPWNHTDDIAEMFKDGRVSDASVSESLRRSLDSARSLETLAKRKGVPIVEPFRDISDASRRAFVAGPSINFYESLLPGFRGTPEPKEELGFLERGFRAGAEVIRKIAESWDFETLDDSGETTAENNSSAILLIKAADDNWLLFTGDAGIPALSDTTDWLETIGFDLSKIKFIQVPHHGSQRNVGPSILDRLVGSKLGHNEKKMTAFVSSPKDGNPKHPSKKVINAFRRRGAPVHATQGSSKCHFANSPDRGWQTSTPLPFYDEVEE